MHMGRSSREPTISQEETAEVEEVFVAELISQVEPHVQMVESFSQAEPVSQAELVSQAKHEVSAEEPVSQANPEVLMIEQASSSSSQTPDLIFAIAKEIPRIMPSSPELDIAEDSTLDSINASLTSITSSLTILKRVQLNNTDIRTKCLKMLLP